jgi:SWI/SNF related-matrix-associated actin-dependent regulator of chromatin subfamily C
MFENNNNVKNNVENNTDSESDIVLYNQKKNIATALYPITKMSNKLFNNFLVDTSNEGDKTQNLKLKKFNKINFLSQNYRPKCDLCGNLCTMDWFVTKDKNTEEESESDNDISIKIDEKSLNKEFYLICEECFSKEDVSLPGDLKKENFEVSSIYNLFSKEKLNEKVIEKLNKEQWTEKEDQKLLEGIKNNKGWEEVVKSLGSETKKTKKDCILHILQMPMKKMDEKYNNDNSESLDEEEDYYNEREDEGKSNIEEIKNSSENDTNVNHEATYKNSISGDNNDLDDKTDILDDEEKKNENSFNKRKIEDMNNNYMIELFMRLLKRYLNEKINNESSIDDKNENVTNKSFKDIIYKTFAKSICKCKQLKKEEKNEIKNIVDILVYLQMKKIELKISYFKQFERVLEYKKTQLKAIETEIMQERIKLITNKFLLQQRQQQQANENN